jgi:hypothetical protein
MRSTPNFCGLRAQRCALRIGFPRRHSGKHLPTGRAAFFLRGVLAASREWCQHTTVSSSSLD